jgi:DNA-binding LacI/PurR family transcriptional regulator
VIWAVPEIGSNRDWVAEQQRLSVPLFFINMQPAPGLAIVSVDNYQDGRLAAGHLLEQGFHRIGIITGPPSWREATQCLPGWSMRELL